MTAFEEELRNLLHDFSEAVELQRSADPAKKPPIRPLLDKLDAVAARATSDIHPRLRHYLEQKSYEKARLFLDGRESENQRGNCGRG